MKCPFCYEELNTKRSNVRMKYNKGTYVARCENCGVDVIISYSDIEEENKDASTKHQTMDFEDVA